MPSILQRENTNNCSPFCFVLFVWRSAPDWMRERGGAAPVASLWCGVPHLHGVGHAVGATYRVVGTRSARKRTLRHSVHFIMGLYGSSQPSSFSWHQGECIPPRLGGIRAGYGAVLVVVGPVVSTPAAADGSASCSCTHMSGATIGRQVVYAYPPRVTAGQSIVLYDGKDMNLDWECVTLTLY